MDGRTCAKAIIDYCIAHDIDAPAYNIQSSNPVGRESIKSLMDGMAGTDSIQTYTARRSSYLSFIQYVINL